MELQQHTKNITTLVNTFREGLDMDLLEKVTLEFTEFDDERKKTIHRFSPGLYIREMQMPAGMLVLGHTQKTFHLNIFLKGKVTMFGESGETTEIEAPMIFTGKPGRKCGYVQEDLVWLNVYPTEETDINKLEDIFLDKSEYSKEFIKEINTRKHDIITDLMGR